MQRRQQNVLRGPKSRLDSGAALWMQETTSTFGDTIECIKLLLESTILYICMPGSMLPGMRAQAAREGSQAFLGVHGCRSVYIG